MERKIGKVERFEDLIAWQKARELTKQIYFLTMKGPFSKDFGLRDQIRRASVSVMSNLAEGFDRGGRAEFHQFVVIAKGSCAEVRSQMYVALDVEYITQKQFDHFYNMTIEISRILGGLRSSLQKQRDKK
ncbi:MAG: four helix bundle protein [Desulfobacterales bacterium]